MYSSQYNSKKDTAVRSHLSSLLSTWKVRSITVVHCKHRMTNVFGLGLSVFINWHSERAQFRSMQLRFQITVLYGTYKRLVSTAVLKKKTANPIDFNGWLTCHREIIEWWGCLVIQIRLLLIPDERAITLQYEIPGPPRFDVLTWIINNVAIVNRRRLKWRSQVKFNVVNDD